jgi:hypothetical protein
LSVDKLHAILDVAVLTIAFVSGVFGHVGMAVAGLALYLSTDAIAKLRDVNE